MLQVSVKALVMGSQEVRHAEVRFVGQSAEDLVQIARDHVPPNCDVQVAVNGRLLDPREHSQPLSDGDSVVISTSPHGVIEFTGIYIINVILTALVTAAISYGVSYLIGRPKPPGISQQRGDDGSSVYGWESMRTGYGQGMLIPWGYGRHAMPGHVIGRTIEATLNGTQSTETLSLIVAIGSGRIDKICGQTGGLAGETARLGYVGTPPSNPLPLPDGLRLNGNVVQPQNAGSIAVWLRMGAYTQSPLPGGDFPGTSQLNVVDVPLAQNDVRVFTYDGTDEIVAVSIRLRFAIGLYATGGQGQPVGAQAVVLTRWRRVGETSWRTLRDPNTGLNAVLAGNAAQPILNAFSQSFRLNFDFFPQPQQSNVSGPFEIQLQRIDGVAGLQEGAWADVVLHYATRFSYPGLALFGVQIVASQLASGITPQFQVPCDLRRVRVWDASLGWSPETWEVPAAPFNFHTHPPGRNPAWIAVHLLLSDEGGRRYGITEANLDLPAFRRWSIYCDQQPGPTGDKWPEARFCCDIVADQDRSLWQWLLAICQAGGAVPFRIGNKISVHYQFRDAHSDSLLAVPAKTPVQLFTSGNVENLVVKFLDRSKRPTVVTYQFLDEQQNYQQAAIPFPDLEVDQDPTSALSELGRDESIQVYGITRRTQLQRDSIFFHRTNRLVSHSITFDTGPYALAAQIGELFWMAHETLQRWAPDVGASSQVVEVVSGTVLWVDHVVAGTGLEVIVRDPDGKPVRADVSAVATVPGHAEWTELQLAASITCVKGAPCVVGKKDKLIIAYQIVAISLGQDMKRSVTAVEWQPAAFDEVPWSEWEDEYGDPGDAEDVLPAPYETGEVIESQMPTAAPAAVTVTPDPRGGYRIGWERPIRDGRSTAGARVYARQPGGAWELLGETQAPDWQHPGFAPGSIWQVSVVLGAPSGAWPGPDQGMVTTYAVEEFPPFSPPDVHGLRLTNQEDGIQIEWDPMELLDFAYYEARVGAHWAAAEIIYRGQSPAFFYRDPRASNDVPIFVAARAKSGLYSLRPTKMIAQNWTPAGRALKVFLNHVTATPPGTLTDLVADTTTTDVTPPTIRCADASRQGTYESTELDGGYEAPWYWRVLWDSAEIETVLVDDCTFLVDSGEARWRTLQTRPASVVQPGVDWELRVDDVTTLIDDLPDDLLVQGHVGEVGSHTRCLIESRYYVSGAWTAWTRHRDGVKRASKLQVRVTLSRETERWQRHLTSLYLAAYI
ncbi:MAG: hypothetical protein EKK55_08735 [Rhodocyclaceae bacterium]|nr:MAG: hypothetical protein EKK55_08735 [Rhodocyclaceae bacterium]